MCSDWKGRYIVPVRGFFSLLQNPRSTEEIVAQYQHIW